MQKKFRVKFRRKVLVWESCDVIVEANDEVEAQEIVGSKRKDLFLDDKATGFGDTLRTLDYDMSDAKVERTAFLALFSGGRDSSAMTDIVCKSGRPLDYIIFSDTNAEFDIMYEYIEKFNARLKEVYNREVKVLSPRTTFESWVFGEMTKGKQKGMTRGLPKMIDPCFWKRESKIRPVERLMKAEGIIDPIKYIGYTNNEKERADVKDPFMRFPLIEEQMCEADVDRHLKEIDMVNKLYEFFSRTGCAFCPYMSMQAYYMVYKQFKKTWAYMWAIEQKLMAMDNVVNDRWSIHYTMAEMQIEFETPGHKYSDEPAKACECKI